MLSNDVQTAARGRRAVQRDVPRGRRRARRPVHLPAGGLRVPDGDQRVQPREGPGLAAGPRRRVRRRRARPARRLRDAGRPGPGCAPGWSSGSPKARCRARFHICLRPVAGVPMLVCGTGYTGEDGVELLLDPEHATTVWDALIDAGATPVGLGARDTLRIEVCFHLYGNDLSEDRNPIEAGLGWCCKEDDGLHRRQTSLAEARRQGTPEKLVPFVVEGQGIARQGNPVLGGGEVTSGTFSPCLERGIGMAYVSTARPSPARASRSTCAAAPGRRWSSASLSTERTRNDGRPELSGRPEVPPRARLGANRRRQRHVRDHLVRPGRPGRGGVLRPARRSVPR